MPTTEYHNTDNAAYDESVYGRTEPPKVCIGCNRGEDDEGDFVNVYGEDDACPDCAVDFERLASVLDGFWEERGTYRDFTSEELASYLMRNGVALA